MSVAIHRFCLLENRYQNVFIQGRWSLEGSRGTVSNLTVLITTGFIIFIINIVGIFLLPFFISTVKITDLMHCVQKHTRVLKGEMAVSVSTACYTSSTEAVHEDL